MIEPPHHTNQIMGGIRDQQNREGSDGRRLKKEPPPQSNLKRPASPLPTETAAVVNTTAHQKRAKDESTTTAPTEQSVESMKISATAVPTISVSNDEFVIPETEEAHRAAYVECLRQCDQELFGVPNQAHQEPGRFGWKEWNKKKQAAVQSTLEEMKEIKLREHNENASYCSSSGSEEIDYPGGGQKEPSAELTKDEITFITALQYCLPLNAGFHVLFESEICYCPCGPNLEPWRTKHNISGGVPCTNQNFSPNALMIHLEMKGGLYEEKKEMQPLKDFYHHAAKVYLQCLYADWHGNGTSADSIKLTSGIKLRGFSHKALHKTLTDKYKKAEREEMRLSQRKIKKLTTKLEEKEIELKELARDHAKTNDNLEALRTKFQVEKKEQEELSEAYIAKCEMSSTKYFDTMKQLVRVLKDGVKITVLECESGDSGFSLQQFFDDLYTQKGDDAHTTLFDDDNTNNKIDKRILSKWEVTYDKREDYSSYKRKADAKGMYLG